MASKGSPRSHLLAVLGLASRRAPAGQVRCFTPLSFRRARIRPTLPTAGNTLNYTFICKFQDVWTYDLSTHIHITPTLAKEASEKTFRGCLTSGGGLNPVASALYIIVDTKRCHGVLH